MSSTCLALANKIKATAQSKSVFDPELRKLRLQLREACRTALLTDPVTLQKPDVEQLLWKHSFYRPIEEFRSRLRTAEGDLLIKTRTAFLAFLADAQRYYQSLAEDLQQRYGAVGFRGDATTLSAMAVPPIVPLQYLIGSNNNNNEGLGIDENLNAGGFSVLVNIRPSVSRCTICIGDLERYALLAGQPDVESIDWRTCRVWYAMSAVIYPQGGNAHNQIAVLAGYRHQDLIAAYHYIRAFSAPEKFSMAPQNLVQLGERCRQQLLQLKQNQNQQNQQQSSLRKGSSSRTARNNNIGNTTQGLKSPNPNTKSNTMSGAAVATVVQLKYTVLLSMLSSHIDIDKFPSLLHEASTALEEQLRKYCLAEERKGLGGNRSGATKGGGGQGGKYSSVKRKKDGTLIGLQDTALCDDGDVSPALAVLVSFFHYFDSSFDSTEESMNENGDIHSIFPKDDGDLEALLSFQLQCAALSAILDTATKLAAAAVALILRKKGQQGASIDAAAQELEALAVSLSLFTAPLRILMQWMCTRPGVVHFIAALLCDSKPPNANNTLLEPEQTLADIGASAAGSNDTVLHQQQELVSMKAAGFFSAFGNLVAALRPLHALFSTSSKEEKIAPKVPGEGSIVALYEDFLLRGYPALHAVHASLDFSSCISHMHPQTDQQPQRTGLTLHERRVCDLVQHASNCAEILSTKCRVEDPSGVPQQKQNLAQALHSFFTKTTKTDRATAAIGGGLVYEHQHQQQQQKHGITNEEEEEHEEEILFAPAAKAKPQTTPTPINQSLPPLAPAAAIPVPKPVQGQGQSVSAPQAAKQPATHALSNQQDDLEHRKLSTPMAVDVDDDNAMMQTVQDVALRVLDSDGDAIMMMAGGKNETSIEVERENGMMDIAPPPIGAIPEPSFLTMGTGFGAGGNGNGGVSPWPISRGMGTTFVGQSNRVGGSYSQIWGDPAIVGGSMCGLPAMPAVLPGQHPAEGLRQFLFGSSNNTGAGPSQQ